MLVLGVLVVVEEEEEELDDGLLWRAWAVGMVQNEWRLVWWGDCVDGRLEMGCWFGN